jgi:hypothetical protein
VDTHASTRSVNILLWVPKTVPKSLELLKTFEVPISDTLLRLSQYMGTVNSELSLGYDIIIEIFISFQATAFSSDDK